jgi:hypothetical protein
VVGAGGEGVGQAGGTIALVHLVSARHHTRGAEPLPRAARLAAVAALRERGEKAVRGRKGTGVYIEVLGGVDVCIG